MCYRFQRPVYVQKKRTLVIEEIEIKYNFQEEDREENEEETQEIL